MNGGTFDQRRALDRWESAGWTFLHRRERMGMEGTDIQQEGLKHFRPASVFEMAVIAIAEQQISLAAAYRIRERLVRRFGQEVGGVWLFPDPERLSGANPSELTSCGLSSRKAEYVSELARSVGHGSLDLDSMKAMGDDEARGLKRPNQLIIAPRGRGQTENKGSATQEALGPPAFLGANLLLFYAFLYKDY